ncbi:hypothetical protein [Clostridium tertium]|uniref:hypothetical protein n=1 Tax=Clostridium tertium TaxID=1559 RepID=UPI0034A1E77C
MIIKFIRNITKGFSGITLNIGLVGFNFDRSGSCRVYMINRRKDLYGVLYRICL